MFLVPRDDPNLTPLNFPPFLPTSGGIPLTMATFVLCTPIAPGSNVETLLLGPPLPLRQVTLGCTRQPPSYQYFGMGFKGVVICLQRVDEQHTKMVVKNIQESWPGRPKYLAILFIALPGISIKAEMWRYISDAGANVQEIPEGPRGWLGLFKNPEDYELTFVHYPATLEEPVFQLPSEEELVIHSFNAGIETAGLGKFTNKTELGKLSFALGYLFLAGIPLPPVPELPGGPPLLLQYPLVLGTSISNQPIRIPTLLQLTGDPQYMEFVEGGLTDRDPLMAALGSDAKGKRGLKRPFLAEDEDTVEGLLMVGIVGNVLEHPDQHQQATGSVLMPITLEPGL
ncbi:hypothetical protein C8Q78DRAFT_992608 [Trametes maxima]|nr:hypothetical protein C8Q78DRAFT_992608 [Trametes maxima]